jgi:hypothetical protein
VLQNNGGNDLPIAANGSFIFSAPVASGSAYAVTIKTQPTNPSQTCVLSGGSGTIVAANISNVVVACTPPAPPGITGELDSFAPGSSPPGFGTNATIRVVDAATGTSITDASVTINNTVLAYSSASGQYAGNVEVPPGGAVSLKVSVAGQSYVVTGTQFTNYPAITAPAPGAMIDTSNSITVAWSAGAPTANASYASGILDAASPASGWIWPLDHNAHVETTISSSYTITPGSITAGNRLVLAGILQQLSIPSAAAGSSFVIGGYTYVPISVTGMPVTARVSGTTNRLNGVVWSGSQFVAVGDSGTILTSSDGATWITRSSGTTDPLEGVVWTGTEYAVVGGSGTFLTSPDGVAWTMQSLHVNNLFYGIAWSGSIFVAVGFTGNILTSPDGINWTQRVSGTQDVLQAVTWADSQFVAVGRAGAILTSPDGVTWTSRGNGGGLYGVTWSGTQFVAVGSSDAPCCVDVILTSPDGIIWTPRTSNAGSLPMAVAWSGSQYLAVGGSGIFATMQSSPDGVNWKTEAAGSEYALLGVAWSGTSFVAVGVNGMILTSP